jgi:DGQHR domain-containing protein
MTRAQRVAGRKIMRRALRISQNADNPLYLFSLTAQEILQVADISRVGRDEGGKLIGYQRPEVRRHIQDIVDYLNGDQVIFPNSIILALSPRVRFRQSRGPLVGDGRAEAGVLEIPLSDQNGNGKPAWIVDGQQRAVALSRAQRSDLLVPISAFLADTVELQRDQFLRVNNTRPLPRGLVTELLPTTTTPLSTRLAARKVPSALCDLLNREKASPFCGIIRRASTRSDLRRRAVVTDTSVVTMIEESLTSSAGCLFPYRNLATGETDIDGIWAVLTVYWSAVRTTFPEAWGKHATESRLMHGVGIRAMGRLMDKIMNGINPRQKDAPKLALEELQAISALCRWTEGTWEQLGLDWNELQNVPKHIRALSSLLIRSYVQSKQAA